MVATLTMTGDTRRTGLEEKDGVFTLGPMCLKWYIAKWRCSVDSQIQAFGLQE
jgi:hypothetical protein